MVERNLAKVEVAGSRPVSRSNNYYGLFMVERNVSPAGAQAVVIKR